ncbi:MAG: hypothetical protein WAZ12_01945 [Candidatus Absconditicoccaceae bacterium]
MFKKVFILSFIVFFVSIFNFNITKAVPNVQDIRLNYCEDMGKNIQDDSRLINIKPGEEKELCLDFSNSSQEDANVFYGFTVGFIDNGSQLCRPNVKEENDFSKFFSNDNGNIRVFPLKSGENKMIKEKIKTPLGMSGMSYGCLMYGIAGGEAKTQMFTIVALVKRSLNLFIGGDADINRTIDILKNKGDIFSTNSKIGAKTTNDGKITLNFKIKNNGNISQNIKINGNMYNVLGYEKIFEVASVLVGPGKEIELKSNELLLPVYKGFFDTQFTLTAEPVFGFNTDNLDAKFKTPTIITETGKIFIFSRIWIIVALVAIIVLVLIFRPLFKKHQQ